MIADNLARVEEQIASVCRRIGRDPKEIILIGVTKYADISQMQQALDAGLTHMGENKIQDAKRKFPQLTGPRKPLTHMIGHLQTNKVKEALPLFDLIQSLDSLRLVEAIEEQADKLNMTAKVLLQVNTAGEEQKFGAAPEEVGAILTKIESSSHIRLQGLMAIAPLTSDKEVIRRCFSDLRKIQERIKLRPAHERIEMRYLSMGMSVDYEIALEEGANMVRIGSAIFK